jgi:predicted metal-binding protein
MTVGDLLTELNLINGEMFGIDVNPSDFIFEERVKLQCFHCKNYKLKWTCPPNIANIDYEKVFLEYKQGLLVYIKLPISNTDFAEKRVNSTLILQRTLLQLEKFLFEHNESLAISFIGGSCKLCKNGCSSVACVNPHLSRIPLEATGCNLVMTLKKFNIDILFPLTDYIYRFGLILW